MPRLTYLWLFISSAFFLSCDKNPSDEQPADGPFSYGDGVFYLKVDPYTVSPSVSRPGTYTAFPDNLNINNATGVITVSEDGKDGEQTQMGLKYKIIFTATTGEKDSTFIVLAGINYQDKIYNLSQNQVKARPFYNADPARAIPPGNYGMRDNDKLVVNPANGEIDLQASINAGLFGDDPQNDDWRVIKVRYKANDNSTEDTRMEIIVYYYDTVADIPSNVSEVMRAHQSLLLGLQPEVIPVTTAPPDLGIAGLVSPGKPRPPCIIIVGH
jgi:hypothetical protein